MIVLESMQKKSEELANHLLRIRSVRATPSTVPNYNYSEHSPFPHVAVVHVNTEVTKVYNSFELEREHLQRDMTADCCKKMMEGPVFVKTCISEKDNSVNLIYADPEKTKYFLGI